MARDGPADNGHPGDTLAVGQSQAELVALDRPVVAVVLLHESIRLGERERADVQPAHGVTRRNSTHQTQGVAS